MNELNKRIQRIYAALEALKGEDISEISADVGIRDGRYYCEVDFSKDSDEIQLENAANTLIANIASIKDHFKLWCISNHKPFTGDNLIDKNREVGLIHDLWNIDKHAVLSRPPRSGVTPKLKGLTTGLHFGSSGGGMFFHMDPVTGRINTSQGDNKPEMKLLADIVDENGDRIGNLLETCMKAIDAWEAELFSAGVPLPQPSSPGLRDNFKLWSSDRSPELIKVIAFRMALRILPLQANTVRADPRTLEMVILPSFRAIAVSCCAQFSPEELVDNSLVSASDAADKASLWARDFIAKTCSYLARVFINTDTSTQCTAELVSTAITAVSAVVTYQSTDQTATREATRSALSQIWTEVETDVYLFEQHLSKNSDSESAALELYGRPLWQNGTCGFTQERWAYLTKYLKQQDQEWDIWIDWYEKRMNGNEEILKLERACMGMSQEKWIDKPELLNRNLRNMMEEN